MESLSTKARTPSSLEQIRQEHPDSKTLRGLVGVLQEKLELRARYPMLRYEAGAENRVECFELIRSLSALEQQQIERLSAVLAHELSTEVPA
jgi:hypothetical protein